MFLPVLIGLLFLIWVEHQVSARLLAAAGRWLVEGRWASVRRWAAWYRYHPAWGYRWVAHFWDSGAAMNLGHTEDAVAAARVSLGRPDRHDCPLVLVNHAITVFVNAGLYEEALATPGRWSRAARENGRRADPAHWAYVRINLAEALHNLGASAEALRDLEDVRELAAGQPVAEHGRRCLKAWIHVDRGELDDARAELEQVDVSQLADYEPEVAYAWAALERDCGNFEEAMRHAEAGLAAAKRASSVRNGHFMVAGIAALAGDAARARTHFEQAANHRYRGQAGEGLERYAAFLEAQGEPDRAREMRRLAVERDPQRHARLTHG